MESVAFEDGLEARGERERESGRLLRFKLAQLGAAVFCSGRTAGQGGTEPCLLPTSFAAPGSRVQSRQVEAGECVGLVSGLLAGGL